MAGTGNQLHQFQPINVSSTAKREQNCFEEIVLTPATCQLEASEQMDGTLPARIDCVVLGAGHAGLATSYELTQRGVPHVILDRGRIAETWRSKRWDAFTMIMPNWGLDLPGFPFVGDRDAFSTRDESIAHFEAYAASFGAPVRSGITVLAIAEHTDDAWPLRVETDRRTIQTRAVVVATGIYQVPRRPWFSELVAPEIVQLDPDHYRTPATVPAGATLVVGSGASGTQIAEDLLLAGRDVWLAVGRAGRQPRRYRGIDSSRWNRYPGISAGSGEQAGDSGGGAARSGRRGGDRDTNLHRFAHDGMRLVGHITGASTRDSAVLTIASDLHRTLAWIDAFDHAWRKRVDAYVATHRDEIERETGKTVTPGHGRPDDALRDGFDQTERTELDLQAEGITSIVWATGYDTDYSVVHFPVIGHDGHPVHEGGVTAVPGLYFVGMTFRGDGPKSSFIGIVGPEAAAIAEQVATTVERHDLAPCRLGHN
jgi:putative flavoprotein involved in K+ transport